MTPQSLHHKMCHEPHGSIKFLGQTPCIFGYTWKWSKPKVYITRCVMNHMAPSSFWVKHHVYLDIDGNGGNPKFTSQDVS
jgi:hypothetical protein